MISEREVEEEIGGGPGESCPKLERMYLSWSKGNTVAHSRKSVVVVVCSANEKCLLVHHWRPPSIE